MSGIRIRAAIVLLAAMATAAIANVLVPTMKIADTRPSTALADLIPGKFGEWTEDRSVPIILPPPDLQATLDKIYNQVVSRTYRNAQGYQIMLSVAYGGDQSDGLGVHRPEVCYPAQGFELLSLRRGQLDVAGRVIPVTRATARLGSRLEPLTYWIINGDQVIDRGWNARLVQLSYTSRGLIPDGMLVRVSSIDPDSGRAFDVQNRFSRQLAAAVDGQFRLRLFGQESQ